MNRQPTREDIQRYLQRWQQLKNQFGDEAVNVPEFNQLTKVIRYIQAQAIQRQQQMHQQPLQQQQQPQQQQQNPNFQQHPQRQPSQTQQPSQQLKLNSTPLSAPQHFPAQQEALKQQQQQQHVSPQFHNQLQQEQAQPFQHSRQKQPFMPMGNNAGMSMINNLGGAVVNPMQADGNTVMSATSNSNSHMGTPVVMNATVGPNAAPMGVNQQSPQALSQMNSQTPSQQQDLSQASNSNGGLGGIMLQNGPLGFSSESPFTSQQMQLLKSQNQAAKFLFKNQGGFPPIPQDIIDIATNERLAFGNNQGVQGAPNAVSNAPAMHAPPVADALAQANSARMLATQSQQKPTPQLGTPQSMHLPVPAANLNLSGTHGANLNLGGGQQFPSGSQEQSKKTAAKRSKSQKSNSSTPKIPKQPEPSFTKPVVRPSTAPTLFSELSEKENLSDQLIVPVTKPYAQVDAFVLPEPSQILSETEVPFNYLYTPQSKVSMPSMLPYFIDADEIMSTRECMISLRIDARIKTLEKELESIANDQSIENSQVELDQLQLLPVQRELRGKLLSYVWFSKSLLPNSHPNFLAKFPDLSLNNVITSEELYKQQLYSLVKAQNKRHQENVSKILSFNTAKREKLNFKKERMERMSMRIYGFHSHTAKEEQKKLDKMAKQRLQALKSNDEEAYLKLLNHTKDDRLEHLLSKTNQFLDSLAQAVLTQQDESKSKNPEGQENPRPEVPEDKKEKLDYYQVAHRIKEEITVQPVSLVGGTLKEYQLKGLQWMVSLYNNRLNGILADEMGLGKTIQTIALLTYLSEIKKIPGPFLVIVPLSTLTNWNLEFEKWAPSLKKITYKGTPAQRKVMQGDIRSGNFQILLTTFEYIIKDKSLLAKIKWVHMIIDEGHRMKNTSSKLSETLTNFYHSDYRLILTGTPLQNKLPELWALLNFVLPKIFSSVKSFDEWFNTPFANTGGQDKIELSEEETLLVIRRLHKVLRPFLLRRLKKDVEKDLPNKVEKVIKCKMSALQSTLYRMMLKYNALFSGESKNGKKPSTIKNANNQLMQLRKICNHPFVYEEVENIINPASETNDNIWRTAGKFELLDRILPKFQKTGHRVLLFFQMTQIMDIMEDFLRLRGMKYMRLDGGTKSDDRTTLLEEFNKQGSEYFCFLLSTRAGGLGLNLQSADTVIIFDSDWNPHQDLQAQDRAHRIGQKNEVKILRLITEDSIEEMILERAVAKLEIDGKVIQAGKFDNKSTSEEQEALLRALLEKEEDRRQRSHDEDQDMDDDELNQIIARSSGEMEVFRELDLERAKASEDLDYTTRLFSESELPDFYQRDVNSLYKTEEQIIEEYGRGNRERKTAIYDDNLTEDEWLKRIDGLRSDGEDEASSKKKGRPKKSEGMKRESSTGFLDDEPVLKRAKSVTPGSRSKKSRTAKPKVRAVNNRSTPAIDYLSPEERERLQSRMTTIFEALIDYKDEERRLSDLFLIRPSRKLYPDYFVLIKHPLAFDAIKKRISNKTYSTIREFLEDIHLIFSNARIYNQEGSIVYKDATILERLAIDTYKKVFPEEETQWAETTDFTEFDEQHQLNPLSVIGTAIKEPVKERTDFAEPDPVDQFDAILDMPFPS